MKIGDFLLFILVLCFLQDIIPLPFINYTDELLMLLALIKICFNGVVSIVNLKLDKVFLAVVLILLTQFFNYIDSTFSNSFVLGIAQSMIHIKAFLILYLTVSIYPIMSRKMVKLCFQLCLSITVLGLVANLLLGDSWHNLMGLTAKYRNGSIRPVGIFENTANLGYFFALFSSIYFVTSSYFSSKKSIYFYFAIKMIFDLILMQIITVRKLIIGVIPVFYMILKKENVLNKSIYLFLSLLFSFFVLIFIEDTFVFQETVLNFSKFSNDDHHYIRGLMFYYGISLFMENFPFGVGAGTFGTIISTINTLDVYHYVGLDLSWLVNDSGKYVGIFDNGLGAYLGENGFIGILSLCYFLKVTYSNLFYRNHDVIFCVFGFTVITSVIGPSWQDGIYSAILSIITIYGFLRSNNEKNPPCNKSIPK